MRRIFTAGILLSLCVACLIAAQAQLATDRDNVMRALVRAEQESWAQRKAGNVEYFNQVPGDYKATMVDGSHESRADLRDRTRNAPLDTYSLNNFNVSFDGDNRANVTYLAQFAGRWSDGTKFDGARRIVSHWELRDGQWQNVRTEFQKP
jgi:hypothetical protein